MIGKFKEEIEIENGTIYIEFEGRTGFESDNSSEEYKDEAINLIKCQKEKYISFDYVRNTSIIRTILNTYYEESRLKLTFKNRQEITTVIFSDDLLVYYQTNVGYMNILYDVDMIDSPKSILNDKETDLTSYLDDFFKSLSDEEDYTVETPKNVINYKKIDIIEYLHFLNEYKKEIIERDLLFIKYLKLNSRFHLSKEFKQIIEAYRICFNKNPDFRNINTLYEMGLMNVLFREFQINVGYNEVFSINEEYNIPVPWYFMNGFNLLSSVGEITTPNLIKLKKKAQERISIIGEFLKQEELDIETMIIITNILYAKFNDDAITDDLENILARIKKISFKKE